ncbi:MAG: aminopeptidase N [Gammaproteobacteria bacterium]|nr:aminopeptidase N [Gammaproteobacteria bacterium]
MTDDTTYLADYRPFPFRLEETHLEFDIREGHTEVRADLRFDGDGAGGDLHLDGQALTLLGVAVDGRELSGNEYRVDEESLTVFDAPARCTVTVRTRIEPEKNTILEGLYKSGAMYCTQCEAEGFRRMVYYPDRPDVLSRFTTTVTADAATYPVLLSNGNLVAEEVREGRRTVTWRDPFPKPGYLFALVAGNLDVVEDTFETMSGRRVTLKIYSEPHNIGQCAYAMSAVKRAMRWDEERFGREYDLDIFMIVAVEDFNAGAMENKGLNIFNTSLLLASPDTATDAAHLRVEAVIGHEYFHNWSGNRVTCRDWFQLSLKEGFTVFRDSLFSADMNSPTMKRVEDVEFLRNAQFPEDAGPLAHPVRPDSYQEISNFYTTTVYEKGAEVVGMLRTLLGASRFRAGSDLYFARHDGGAVTTEDFVDAMAEVSGMDLTQFRRWYDQAGTPVLTVSEARDDEALTLTVVQDCPPTPQQEEKRPFHLPLAIGLLDEKGADLLGAAGDGAMRVLSEAFVENPDEDGTLVAHLVDRETTLRFEDAPRGAVVSFLRGFSAPVKVRYERSGGELLFLAAHDTDGFARWDAAQTLLARAMIESDAGLDANVLELFDRLTQAAASAPDDGEAKALLAAMMDPPRAQYVLDLRPGSDILHWCDARDDLLDRVSERFRDRWLQLYGGNATHGAYVPDGPGVARRGLKNRALALYARTAEDAETLLADQFEQADNLTDREAALSIMLESARIDDARKQAACDAFYERWRHEALLVDVWLRVQAGCDRPGALKRVRSLEGHSAFDMTNPNKVRALFAAFAANTRNFHASDGEGYGYLADRIARLDEINAKMAARLATPLTRWERFDRGRQRRMCAALRRLSSGEMSKDLAEVVSKSLARAEERLP